MTLTEHLGPSRRRRALFDLQIDGETKAAAVGDLGSTGPIEVTDGEHSVSELASAGTDLGDYEVEITCTEDTNPASPLTVTGASLGQIPVAAGDDWRCDFTSTRADDTIDLDCDRRRIDARDRPCLLQEDRAARRKRRSDLGRRHPLLALHLPRRARLPDP